MKNSLADLDVSDGDTVTAEQIPLAVTAGPILYEDGSTQTFDAGGATTYVENGRPTAGEWYVDADGRFCSYWPPSYRACYDLRWVVENGHITGLRFTDNASVSVGRYQ
jgi:hypothetical protein